MSFFTIGDEKQISSKDYEKITKMKNTSSFFSFYLFIY